MHLTLVGTGHVFRIGALVTELIETRRPDLVCVELDPVRLQGLREKKRLADLQAADDPRAEEMVAAHRQAIKRLPLMYRFMARTQERLATQEGVEPGSEMLAAVEAARTRGLPIATIDVDAQALIRRAWSQMSLRERLRFLWAMLRGQGGSSMEKEMSEYQDDPVVYLAKVGNDFPTLKRVLIDERDRHMAARILDIPRHRDRLPGAPERPRVVAVVGDGHVEGMLAELRQHDDVELEVVRVGALRAGTIPPSPFPPRADRIGTIEGEDPGSVSFQVDVQAPLDMPPDRGL